MMKNIGGINSCIAGDYRYSDRLRVDLHDDGRVSVTVRCTGAVGGMDGPGGAYDAGTDFSRITKPQPTAKDVMAIVREALGSDRFSFRRYGKPTQRFTWVCGDHRITGRRRGLSVAICAEALAFARKR